MPDGMVEFEVDLAATQALEARAAQGRAIIAARKRARRAKLDLAAQLLVRSLATIIRDVAGLAGAFMISLGAWQIYQPAGIMLCGAFLLLGAWISGARAGE